MTEARAAAPAALPTAAVADACLRTDTRFDLAPPGIHPVVPGVAVAGAALPVRHAGSVDVFLEAFEGARRGDVMVIDNAGRTDAACIGDLTVLEARRAGLAGIVLWGLHRDMAELRRLAFPVWSYGVLPAGPHRLDARAPDALTMARFGGAEVTRADYVVADDDGVVFFPAEHRAEVFDVAAKIVAVERAQAEEARSGRTLREQFAFREYLERRKREPDHTFRRHLRELRKEVEE